MWDELKNIDSEMRNVKILTAEDALTIDNVVMPDEVPVFASAAVEIGRARLRKTDDSVYADITLYSGTTVDMEASVIGHSLAHDGAAISRYQVTGVGLMPKAVDAPLPITAPPVAKTEETVTDDVQTEVDADDNTPGLGG